MNAVDKLRAHELLHRKWRRRLTVEQRDVLGLLIDQITGLGRVSRALSYRDLINNEHAPACYSERQLREHIAALEARGAIRVERPAGRKMVITLTLESEPRSDAAQPQTPAVRRRGRPEPRQSAAGDPGSRPPPPLNRPRNNRPRTKGTDHEESSPAAPASAQGVVVSDEGEGETATRKTADPACRLQPVAPAPAPAARAPYPSVRNPRRRFSKREYAEVMPALRAAWDDAHVAAEWRQHEYVPPAWTGKDRGLLVDIHLRLGADVGKTCAFLTWSVTFWRGLLHHDKLRSPPAYPEMPFLTGYFGRFHGAWQRGAEREWLDLLPFEERRLANLLANGHNREAAPMQIAEDRVRAKHRDEFAKAEARIDRKLRTVAAAEKSLEITRRRNMGTRPPVRRGGPAILIEDATPEAIGKELDRQMANYTPPDFDHDPYDDPAAG